MNQDLKDIPELFEVFISDAERFLSEFPACLEHLESARSPSTGANCLLQILSDFKATCGFAGLPELNLTLSYLEQLLTNIKKGVSPVDDETRILLQEAFTVISGQVESIRKTYAESGPDADFMKRLKQKLREATDFSSSPDSPPASEAASPEQVAPEGTSDAEADFQSFITREIIENFLTEARENLENLNSYLLEFERDFGNQDLINSIFREYHSLKGNSGFLSFHELEKLTHTIEDLLNRLRRQELKPNRQMIDLFFRSLDVIENLLQQYEKGSEIAVDWKPIARECEKLIREDAGATPVSAAAAKAAGREKPGPASPHLHFKDKSIRVDVNRLDVLMNLVGELVLARNRINQILSSDGSESFFLRENEEFRTANDHLEYLVTEIQSAVLQVRMVPIARVFSKFPRMIRDLARSSGKEIQFETAGEHTEVDKSVIEVISDPLIHILRNAVDHGIETPEERKKAGKPPMGTIRLSAYHEGNNIVIKCRDDGRGMDPQHILNTALERKVISEKAQEKLSKADILNLIFMPGFSTADKVTSVSGRGVGMDVVKTNITRLNGFIEVDSHPGSGTTFTLRFPLTMAIIQGLLVTVRDEIFIVPINAVLETFRMDEIPVRRLNGKLAGVIRDQLITLIPLDRIFQLTGEEGPAGNYLVLVGHGDKKMGLVVDGLIGQEEVVIKPLGNYLKKLPGISGATILGDGRVRFVLDVGGIMRLGSYQTLSETEA